MGNSSSAVTQRVEHGSKTGVCSLRELKLEQVNNAISVYVSVVNKKLIVSAPWRAADYQRYSEDLRLISEQADRPTSLPGRVQQPKNSESLSKQTE